MRKKVSRCQERGKCLHRSHLVGAGCLDRYLGTGPCGEPHHRHDILGICAAILTDEEDLAVELAGGKRNSRGAAALQADAAGHFNCSCFHRTFQ